MFLTFTADKILPVVCEQEAQLCQVYCTMLHVIEYFAKSFKVI